MLLLFNNEGRFAHQLNQFAFLMALSLEYQCHIHYPSFEAKYMQFLDTDHSLIRKYYRKRSVKTTLYIFFYKFLKAFRIHNINNDELLTLLNYEKSSELLNEGAALHDALKAHKTVITDTMIKEIPKSLQYRKQIRPALQIATSIRRPMDSYLHELRQKTDILVGMHFRRGDYREFMEGRLFYSNQQYKRLMEHFITLHPGRTVAFIICSDEHVNLLDFEGLPVQVVQRSLAQDFYILQSVDYIIGPHSIFTLMANYLSDNKLYQIFDPNQLFTMDDFLTSKDTSTLPISSSFSASRVTQ